MTHPTRLRPIAQLLPASLLLPMLLCATQAPAAEGIGANSTQNIVPRTLGTVAVPLHATRTVESGPAIPPRYQRNESVPAYGAAPSAPMPYVTTLPRAGAPGYAQHPVTDRGEAYAPQTASAAGSVQAPLDYLVFSGGEVSGHRGEYGNLGAIGAIGNTHFGNGPVWRVMTDALGYNYVGGPSNSTIEGTAYAGEAALGYILSGQNGSSVAGYVGGVYRHTSLSPNDPGNQLRGGQWGLKTQAEGTLYYTPDIRSGLQAAYVFGPDNWWMRANTQYRPSFLPWGRFFIGPEAVLQGDSTYTAYQIGGLINGIHVGETSEIGIRAGYKKIENLTGTAYGGAEFSTMF